MAKITDIYSFIVVNLELFVINKQQYQQ